MTGIDALERVFDPTKYGRIGDALADRGDDPVARRPVAGRRCRARDAGPERAGPVGARHAARWDLGRPPRGARRRRCCGRSRRSRPGSRARVVARQVLTPPDLERDYGLTGGHPLHAEPALDSFFAWRPLLGLVALSHAARRPLPGRLGRAPGRRRHRRARPERGARGARGPQAPLTGGPVGGAGRHRAAHRHRVGQRPVAETGVHRAHRGVVDVVAGLEGGPAVLDRRADRRGLEGGGEPAATPRAARPRSCRARPTVVPIRAGVEARVPDDRRRSRRRSRR